MALKHLLQPLKFPQSSGWHLVIAPDPRIYKGFQRLPESSTREFCMSLQTNLDAAKYTLENPICGVSSNFPSPTPEMRPFQQRSESQWIRFVAPDATFPRAALRQLLDKFPTYNLQSKEEAMFAIMDIEKILSCLTISEGKDGDVRE